MSIKQPSLILSRRSFLHVSATCAALFLGAGCSAPIGPTKAKPTRTAEVAMAPMPDLTEITLTARLDDIQILPGATTKVWRYQGEVIQGNEGTVQAIPGSYLGPILHLRRGQKVRINLQNALNAATIIHWHGLIVPPAMDGHPADSIAPGANYVYEFEVKNRAGTYWFHPHPHEDTAHQAYMGLAGLVLITDEEEAALALPTGAYDLPLVIQDRTFDADNQLVYLAGGAGHGGHHGGHDMGGAATNNDPMAQTMGFLGDRILVNGVPDLVLPIATRVYRLRLLNGSNSRIYKLAWSNGAPIKVIATDGGLLAQPVERSYVTLAPGERVELWADFSQLAVGDEVKLQSLAYQGVEAGMVMNGMLMQMAETATLPNGEAFDLLTLRVERAEAETLTLPAQLSALGRIEPATADNAAQPRVFALGMSGGQWQINGKPFIMAEVDAREQIAFGATELWEFRNELPMIDADPHAHAGHSQAPNSTTTTDEMIDFMAHPMHIHGVQFQVLNRQIDPTYEAGWRTLKEGFVDEGWKDTVLVMPGERVQIGLRFVDYPGRYLLHCHNLEHENGGMMRNFLIG